MTTNVAESNDQQDDGHETDMAVRRASFRSADHQREAFARCAGGDDCRAIRQTHGGVCGRFDRVHDGIQFRKGHRTGCRD